MRKPLFLPRVPHAIAAYVLLPVVVVYLQSYHRRPAVC
nr:MAG TPA: hypothetical protein [Caudoviricetes sp.]